MNLQITGLGVEVTDRIKRLIDKRFNLKLEKLLKPFSPDIKRATIRLEQITRTKDYKANFDMSLPGKEKIYASFSHKSLVSTITGLREQIEHQIKKYRDSLKRY